MWSSRDVRIRNSPGPASTCRNTVGAGLVDSFVLTALVSARSFFDSSHFRRLLREGCGKGVEPQAKPAVVISYSAWLVAIDRHDFNFWIKTRNLSRLASAAYTYTVFLVLMRCIAGQVCEWPVGPLIPSAQCPHSNIFGPKYNGAFYLLLFFMRSIFPYRCVFIILVRTLTLGTVVL